MQGDTLGTRIKQLRKGRQLTQAQLAKELYLSESYVAYIETDQRNPSMDVVARMADYFHVSADYLINGDSQEPYERYMKKWSDIIKGHSQKDIDTALNIVQAFFSSIDSNSDS